ncbi:hypothetical protein HPB51_022181 [Rhipicephalus microplus]|uniref:Uncharacterized protein n=1 Tax=Rhipicephalus microplus TaxID=6941 RepID=A0A9J6F932_RHIMP|nr:hypothetical protein HPB51_022181 [Rhipicephalus microplus]
MADEPTGPAANRVVDAHKQASEDVGGDVYGGENFTEDRARLQVERCLVSLSTSTLSSKDAGSELRADPCPVSRENAEGCAQKPVPTADQCEERDVSKDAPSGDGTCVTGDRRSRDQVQPRKRCGKKRGMKMRGRPRLKPLPRPSSSPRRGDRSPRRKTSPARTRSSPVRSLKRSPPRSPGAVSRLKSYVSTVIRSRSSSDEPDEKELERVWTVCSLLESITGDVTTEARRVYEPRGDNFQAKNRALSGDTDPDRINEDEFQNYADKKGKQSSRRNRARNNNREKAKAEKARRKSSEKKTGSNSGARARRRSTSRKEEEPERDKRPERRERRYKARRRSGPKSRREEELEDEEEHQVVKERESSLTEPHEVPEKRPGKIFWREHDAAVLRASSDGTDAGIQSSQEGSCSTKQDITRRSSSGKLFLTIEPQRNLRRTQDDTEDGRYSKLSKVQGITIEIDPNVSDDDESPRQPKENYYCEVQEPSPKNERQVKNTGNEILLIDRSGSSGLVMRSLSSPDSDGIELKTDVRQTCPSSEDIYQPLAVDDERPIFRARIGRRRSAMPPDEPAEDEEDVRVFTTRIGRRSNVSATSSVTRAASVVGTESDRRNLRHVLSDDISITPAARRPSSQSCLLN